MARLADKREGAETQQLESITARYAHKNDADILNHVFEIMTVELEHNRTIGEIINALLNDGIVFRYK